MSEEILCIYHYPCLDGFAAAWCMKHHMPQANIKFLPMKYGDPAPDVTGRIVYILDFSFPRDVTKHMIDTAAIFLNLDHHESALKNLIGLDCDREYMLAIGEKGADSEYAGQTVWISDKGRIVLDMSRSGAGMAWDYFAQRMKNPLHPHAQPRPALINHIEDRDLWNFKLGQTKEINAALFSYEYDFDIWDYLMESDPGQLYREGVGILRKQQKDIKELLSIGTRAMIIGGSTIPTCNLPYTLASEGCHELLKQWTAAPFTASYMDQQHGRVFSLRSTKERRNVSEVAMSYGGGGHRNAAGFTAPIGWEGDLDTSGSGGLK